MDARHNKLKDKKVIFIWIGIIVAIIITFELYKVKPLTENSKVKTEATIQPKLGNSKILNFDETFVTNPSSAFVEGFVELLSKKR
jgi:hypothetical protein